MMMKPRSTKWYQDHRQDPEYLRKRAEYNREYHLRLPSRRLHRVAKFRAKQRNIPFSINIDDIFIPSVCPILNVPFEHNTQLAPSLDRIDNTKGYTKDNVQVVSRRANVMKSDASPEELLKFAEWVFKTYGTSIEPSEEEA